MIDREKVIQGLEETEIMLTQAVDRGGEMAVMGAFKCLNRVKNALDLLKEQKHSETFIVIDDKTGKEADTYDIALHEDWAKHLCYCDMEGWAIEDDGTLLLVDECGQFAYADRERFKVKWE